MLLSMNTKVNMTLVGTRRMVNNHLENSVRMDVKLATLCVFACLHTCNQQKKKKNYELVTSVRYSFSTVGPIYTGFGGIFLYGFNPRSFFF